MEEPNNVRFISQKEASQIDANNVDYYTLTDGTIIHIKREGEEGQLIGEKNQGQEQQKIAQSQEIEGEGQQIQNQFINQNIEIQNSTESNQINQQYQQQSQIKTQNQQILTESENQYQINGQINSNLKYQGKEEILQPVNNDGYFNRNIPQNQNQQCTCNHNISQGYYNAQLIDAQIGQKYIISQLGLKNLALSGPQFCQQGQIRRRQLYKLVEAYPIRINDIMRNQNTNVQINSQQYNSNTYLTEQSRYQNMKQKMEMNMNSQEQINQNNIIQNKTVQNVSLNQRIEANNHRFEQPGQMEDNYCNCEQNECQMKQEYQEGEELNDQNIDYCNCDLKYSEISLGKGNRALQDKGENNAQCTCPIGNSGMKKTFEIINQESDKKE